MDIPCGAASVVIITTCSLVLVVPEGKRFQITGGKTQRGETSQETAIREAREEAGISLSSNELMPLCRVEVFAKGQKGYHVFFYVVKEDVVDFQECRLKKCPKWVPLVELTPNKFYWRGYRTALKALKKIQASL